MDFSMIVPIYNVESYIESCINSLLDQADISMEIILVDDGSTDSSGDICDRYAKEHKYIHVIHQNNKGASAARNAGIAHAAGDYILFVDGDDSISKNSLRNIQKEIITEEYPDIVFLECKKVFFNRENHIIREIPMMDGVTAVVRAHKQKELLSYIAHLPKYPASPCTKAIKRKLFLDHDLMFQNGLLNEDLEWAVRLFLAVSSAGYCSQDYYFYRQNRTNSSSSIQSEKKAMDMLFIVEKWISNLKNYHEEEEKQLIKSLMEYIFRFLILDVKFVSREKIADYKRRVNACDIILGERVDNVSRLIRFVYKTFGINISNLVLQGHLKLRNTFYKDFILYIINFIGHK